MNDVTKVAINVSDRSWPIGTRMSFVPEASLPAGWKWEDDNLSAKIAAAFPGPTIPSPDPPSRNLTPQGRLLKSEWDHLYKLEGCKCTEAAACRYCSHPGNPFNLEANPNVWEEFQPQTKADRIMQAIRAAAGKGGSDK